MNKEQYLNVLEKAAKRQQKRWKQPASMDITYMESLERYSKTELLEVSRYLGLSGVSNYTKLQLIEELDTFRDMHLHLFLSNLTTPQLKRLEEGKENGFLVLEEELGSKIGWWTRSTFLIPMMIKGNYGLLMPKEIRESEVFTLFYDEYSKKIVLNDQLILFTRGLLNTQGVMRFTELCNELRKYVVAKGTDFHRQLRDFLWVQQDYNEELFIRDHLCAAAGVHDAHKLFYRIEQEVAVERVKLEASEVLKWADEYYFLTLPSYQKLTKHLIDLTGRDEETIEDILFDMMNLLNDNRELIEIVDFLEQALGETLCNTDKGTLQLIQQACMHTPHWFLKGHRPVDLN